ncbi:MAG: hypothetical protein LBQ81_08620 [Zoogloeaceae bacterium]|jgi:hypothetical protein|nr:hypothetical protein [Zoogloeaceae bacterium]
MRLDAVLLVLLLAVCASFIWLDMRGISLASIARRAMLARRVRKNLGLSWRAAWAITGGRKC